MKMKMLVMMMLVMMKMMMVNSDQYLVMLDQTRCSGDERSGVTRVTGADQVSAGLTWTLDKLDQLNIVNKDSIGVEMLDSCSDAETGSWRLMTKIGSMSSSGSVNQTHPPHLISASQLNTHLINLTSSLTNIRTTLVNPTSAPGAVAAVSSLVSSLHWSQTFLISSSHQLSSEMMPALSSCVLNNLTLPTDHDTKNIVTDLLTGVSNSGVNRIVVTGNGADIARLVRNVYELNLNISIIALPWDGSISDIPGTDMKTVSILQVVPAHFNMPQFMKNTEWSSEHLSLWPVVKAVFGVLVVDDAGVDDDLVKTSLQLSREVESYRIESLDLVRREWRTVGLYEEGEVRWTQETLSSEIRDSASETSGQCHECVCVNVGVTDQPRWRHETWVTVLVSVSGVGVVSALIIILFMCSQCGQVLEGSQVTSVVLLVFTIIMLLSVAPFCLVSGLLVCQLRSTLPGAVVTTVLSIIVSRSLLLATSDTDGLPGHASGCLQAVLTLVLVLVQAGVVSVSTMMKSDSSLVITAESLTLGVQCTEDTVTRVTMYTWPALLLTSQILLTPLIWRSRRNYREGVLFSVCGWFLVLVTVGWVCAEIFIEQFEEVSTAAALVSAAIIILIVIFLPKIYMINKWGSGSEISLHLPATATSTLHTDTIDYVRGTDIYNDSSAMLYDNNPGNRRGLTHILSQYQKSSTLLSSDTSPATLQLLSRSPHNNSTYKLDSNTEPDPNISWEPFSGTGPRRSSVVSDQETYHHSTGVSSIFASNMQGYGYYNGYNSPLQHTDVKSVPSTKL